MTIIDGTGQIMGRLASGIAKRLLNEEEIIVLNAEKVLITGTREDLMETYGGRRLLGGPRGKGPYYPRYPDQLVKRTVRGMLPYKKPNGRMAYKRLKVYVGVPAEFDGAEMEKPMTPAINRRSPYMEVGELAKSLGAKL